MTTPTQRDGNRDEAVNLPSQSPWVRYAHVLDGEDFRLRILHGSTPRAAFEDLEQTLKIYALVGCPLVLSDVQATDSVATLHLFRDQEFLKYLDAFPDWLSLRARVAKEDKTKSERLGALRSGLRRALVPDWSTSAFSSTAVAQAFAEKLLGLEAVDESALLSRDSSASIVRGLHSPADRNLAEGLVRLFGHFLRDTRTSAAEPPPVTGRPPTYYDVLKRLQERFRTELDRGGQSPSRDPEFVDELLLFIDNAFPDPADRHRRALLKERLDFRTRRHGAYWDTVVHAWNFALQESLVVPAGACVQLPLAVPIARYWGDVVESYSSDSTVVERARENRNMGTAGIQAMWERNLTELSWTRIREISDATQHQRLAYSASRADHGVPEEQSELFTALLNAVVKQTAGDAGLSRRGWFFGGLTLVGLANDLFHGHPGKLLSGAPLLVDRGIDVGKRALKRRVHLTTIRRLIQG
jgi:hypothetical protein